MPLCVGHEVIGRALKVGKDVKTIKVGDRVGVGAQIRSCLECGNCKADQENYCPNGKSFSCIEGCQDNSLTYDHSRRHLRRQVR
jgi:D-arabinose 1-dehydrogenase-like Zn-dependent alcohol dehydrogenase